MEARYWASADSGISTGISTILRGCIRLCVESEHHDAPLAYTSSKIPLTGTQIINSVLMLLFLNQDPYRILNAFSVHFIKLQKGSDFELSSLPLQGKILLAKKHTGHLYFLRVMPVFPSFRHEKREKNPCSLIILDHLCTEMDLPGCLQQLSCQFALGVGTASQKPGPPSSKKLKLCNSSFSVAVAASRQQSKKKMKCRKKDRHGNITCVLQ